MANDSLPRDPQLIPHTAFAAPPEEVESGLERGDNQGPLEDYFGPEAYRQLRDMALNASKRSVRGGPRVLILPGIMGSTLSRGGLFGTLWIDPVEILAGRLAELKLGSTPSTYRANGVILLTYLKLKLRLKIAGFDADFYPFDWRQSVADLGLEFGAALAKESAGVQVVAHSMGGLVARAALNTPGGAKLKRLIMLGTPNYGSYAALQALRGTADVVRKLQKLDRTTPQLARDVFSTFPGLYELMPSPGKFDGANIYDGTAWPANDPRPVLDRLAATGRVLEKLAKDAPGDARCHLIAGVNQQTPVGARVENGEFVYDYSAEGDGTVPLSSARLDGIPASQIWYVEEQHGNLPNHDGVERAVLDLLNSGATQALPATPPPPSRARSTTPESQLRTAPVPSAFGTSDYRHLLEPFASPVRATAEPVVETASPTDAEVPSGAPHSVVIGRRRQRRLEITLANGSLTEADAQAYVLGIFQSVAPSGAAKAIDDQLDGAISDFTARRIFSGEVGELFTLPATRSRLAADVVVFAGLGAFDRFTSEVHQLVAENIMRMMVRCHVSDFATVLIGAGTGQSVASVLRNLLTGFLRALDDVDPRYRFRSITLCETDTTRFVEMREALLRIAGGSLCDDVELTLEEMRLPPPAAARGVAPLAAGPEPVYAMIRQEVAADAALHFQISLLGSGRKAAVMSVPHTVDPAALDALLKDFDNVAGTNQQWNEIDFGKRFAELMLPPPVRDMLTAWPERHLVLVHDAAASRIPWETLTIGDWTPGLGAGLSRRYLADDLPIATWLEQRRAEPSLKLLLIVDPTENLEGARQEGDRLLKLAATTEGLEVTELRGPRATKQAVLTSLRSGKFDIVHYAGHAFFDDKNRARSGLLLSGEEVLSGADLAGASNLPFLVFFNACQAGRVRGENPDPAAHPPTEVAARSYGVAEAMMRGGIANYLSTYWPVRDDAAETFATTFYQGVLNGAAVGAALLTARKAVNELKVHDWADYILYGTYDFILKRRS
jgi:pimeloyl-ACP methyl ester carboxylesterase